MLAVWSTDVLSRLDCGGDIGHLWRIQKKYCFCSSMDYDCYYRVKHQYSFGRWLETCLSLDNEGPISTNGDLLLHHAKVVKPADEEACTLGTQVEVHIITCETIVERVRCEYLDNNGGKNNQSSWTFKKHTGSGCTAHSVLGPR